MELPAPRSDRRAGVGDRLRVPGGRWRLRRHRRARVRPRGRPRARPRHQPVRHRRGLRLRGVGGGARPRAARPPRRGASCRPSSAPGYQDRPNFRDGTRRAGARVDRREPAAARHRPRRRVHRALARPRHAVRGDAGRARRARAARARCASSASRTSPPTSSTACTQIAPGRRRAVRARPVRPADGARRSSRTAPDTTSRSSGTARSPTGC